jgi:hypothetical protein
MFQKPNKKSFTDSAVQAVALGLGMKVGDGIAAVMPDSVSSYKHWIVMALGLAIAASVSTKTTSGLAAQSAALGIAGNGFYYGISEVISPSVPTAETPTTTSEKFVKALVEGRALGNAYQPLGNAFQWEPAYEVGDGNWDREPQAREIKIALV